MSQPRRMENRQMRLETLAVTGVLGSVFDIHEFLGSLSADYPSPIVVMPRDDEGIRLMVDLSFMTPLPVCWAQAGITLKPGTVYVASPGTTVVVRPDRVLGQVSSPHELPQQRAETLFGSIAQAYGADALAISLGELSPASVGALAVKNAGGTLIVDSRAVEAGRIAMEVADFVLAPAEAARMLSSLAAELVAGIAAPLASQLIDVLRDARQVWSTRLGNIQLLESGSTLKLAVHQGFRRPFIDHFRVVNVDDGATCGRALRHGQRIVVEDIEADQEFTPHRSVAAAAGYRAVQSTPIVGRDRRFLGVISTHSSVPRQLAANEARDFDHLAVRAAGLIEQMA